MPGKANGQYAARREHLHAIEEADSEIRIAQRALDLAQGAEADAVEAAAARLQEEFKARYQKHTMGLAKALAMASGANARLLETFEQAQAALGTDCGLEPLHWRELLDGDSRLTNWRRAAGLHQ